MAVLRYPSPQFPAFPAVSLHIPDTWRGVDAAGAVIAAAEARNDGHFASNVTATVTRHTAGYEVRHAVEEAQLVLGALPDAKVEDPLTARLGDRDFVGCNVAFREASSGTLVQVHLFTTIGHGSVVDLVHLVGTCAAECVPDAYVEIQQILKSVEIEADPQ